MTQHPFDREYSEQEAQKLNSESTESTTPANEDELTEEEAEAIAGGITIPGGIGITSMALGEEGGFPFS